MALRILPFRQYSDHDVVNLFSIVDADVLDATSDAAGGGGDAGVFVSVTSGNFDQDPVTYQTNSYLGDTSYPFLGTTEMYPEVNLRVTGATSGTHPLGLTLYQTAKNDENGEKLLYNPVKKDELQAVLSGQACPVATKGLFTFAAGGATSTFSAFGNNTTTVPGNLAVIDSSNNGQMVGVTPETVDSPNTPGYRVVGHIIATGERTSQNGQADYFAGTGTAGYAMVQFDASASWQAHGN